MSIATLALPDALKQSLRQARLDCARCLAGGGVFVVAGPSPALTDALPQDWLHEDDRRRAERYQRPDDRTNFIAGRRLLAGLLQQGRALPPLDAEPSGKPLPVRGIHFNLSHSGTWVAVALSRSGALGVDIESRAGFEPFAAVSDRISHPEERAWVHATGSAREMLMRRLEVWTRKEALLKAAGEGLGFDAVHWSSLPAKASAGSRPQYSVRTFTGPRDAWVLSVAYRCAHDPWLAVLLND